MINPTTEYQFNIPAYEGPIQILCPEHGWTPIVDTGTKLMCEKHYSNQ